MIDFPADLPAIIEYRCGPVVIRSLPRRPVVYISTSGNTNCRDVHPVIPPGATAWRLVTEDKWHPMNTIPPAWMPFLNRRRNWEHDPRPAFNEPGADEPKDERRFRGKRRRNR